jgi:hypothetical protein
MELSVLDENGENRARLEPYRDFVLRYLSRFESHLIPHLQNSMELALIKLCAMSSVEFEGLLRTYQYARHQLRQDQTTQGIGELWRLLTLIQLAYPNWRHVDHSDYANIEIEEDDLIHLIYSVNQDTMPEIILDLAERNLRSRMRSFFKRLGFPRRIILENANRELGADPKENLCQHCRDGGGRTALGRIVEDYGHVASQNVLLGVEINSIGDDFVNLICSDCVRQVRACVELTEVLSRLREVI